MNPDKPDKDRAKKSTVEEGVVTEQQCLELEDLNEIDDAIECYKKLILQKRKEGDKYGVCICLGKIGSLFRLKRDFKIAAEYINYAIKCAEELNNKKFLAFQYVKMGNLYQTMDKLNMALLYYTKAQEIFFELDDWDNDTRNLSLSIMNNRAVIFLLQGNIYEAKKELSKIINIFRTYGNFSDQMIKKYYISSLVNLGNLLFEMGDVAKAEAYLTEAKEIMEKLEEVNPRRRATIYLNLAYFLTLTEKLEQVRKILDEVRKILPKDDKSFKVHYLINLSKYWKARGDIDTAIQLLLKAKELGQRIGHEYAEGLVYNELGLIYKDQEDLRTSLEYLTKARKFFETLDFYKHKVRNKIDEIESNFISIAIQWGRKVEEKDPYTLGHSARTTYYAFLIGQKIFVNDEISLKGLIIGGFLHDIGKLMIDDRILLKPTRLTLEEFEEIKKHPIYAIEQLKNIEFPWSNVRDCILYHHEKFDGSGYPEGLAGEEIPLSARIIAVADVFDALTTDRPYRDPWPWDKALDFIVSLKNMAFDPEIVDIFVEVIKGLDESLISTQYTEQMVRELWRFFK